MSQSKKREAEKVWMERALTAERERDEARSRETADGEWIERLQEEIEELQSELAKHQQSEFHPDWSLLKATQASLREHMALVKSAQAELAKVREERDEAQRAKYGTPCSCESWIAQVRASEERAESAEARVKELEAALWAGWNPMTRQSVVTEAQAMARGLTIPMPGENDE